MKQLRDTIYTIRLTPEERRKIEAAAADNCTSGGAIMRLALKRFLKETEGSGRRLENEPATLSQNA